MTIMRLALASVLALLACSWPARHPMYKVYITNRDSSTVTIILPNAGFPSRRLAVGRGPTYVAATQKGDLVLVSNTGDSTVSFISTRNDRVVGMVRVPGLLQGIAVDLKDRYALVANETDAEVVVIDVKARQVVKRIPVGAGPRNFAFDDETEHAFVTCAGANTVDVINLARLEKVGSIPSGSQPDNPLFVRGWLVVTSGDRPMVYFSDAAGVFDSVKVSTGAHGIAADPEGTMLYVTAIDGQAVQMIDLAERKVLQTDRVARSPNGVAVSPDGLLVFVACAAADQVVVSTVHEANVGQIESPGSPFWVAIAQLSTPKRSPKAKVAYTDISTFELAGMLKNKDFRLVAVQVPDKGEIPGTDAHVPYNQVAENVDKFPEDKSARIVVYGSGGAMSVVAARKLAELGYTNVFNLKHGSNRWQARGMPFSGTR